MGVISSATSASASMQLLMCALLCLVGVAHGNMLNAESLKVRSCEEIARINYCMSVFSSVFMFLIWFYQVNRYSTAPTPPTLGTNYKLLEGDIRVPKNFSPNVSEPCPSPWRRNCNAPSILALSPASSNGMLLFDFNNVI